MPRHRKIRPVSPSKDPPGGDLGTIVAHHGVAVKVALDDPSVAGSHVPFHPGSDVTLSPGDAALIWVKVRPKSGHVVGDRVRVAAERLLREPRERALLRRHPSGGVHTLAAHLDVVAVVVASHPELKPGLVDRAIVSARSCGIRAVIVVNKIELDGAKEFAATMRAAYSDSLDVYEASAHEKTGLDAVFALLSTHGRGAFVGPSGVGKSSLLNAMLPAADLVIGNVSEATGKGRHTTVVATLHTLPGGGELVDTPGLREFGLVHVEPEELARYFPGFETVLETPCRFRNCLHEHEPGCAVLEAVSAGALDAERLKTYHALLHELIEEQARANSGRGR